MAGTGEYGEIYFDQLFDHLRNCLQEDFEGKYRDIPPQQPLFAGLYASNPLLFVNTEVTLAHVELKRARYSAQYVRRQVRFWAAAIACSALLLVTGYWIWLDQHVYLEADNGYVRVMAGYPGLSGFGFPRLIFETDITTDLLDRRSPLVDGNTVVAQRTENLRRFIEGHLSARGAGLWAYWQGDSATAAQRPHVSDFRRSAHRPAAGDVTCQSAIDPSVDKSKRPDGGRGNPRLELCSAVPRQDTRTRSGPGIAYPAQARLLGPEGTFALPPPTESTLHLRPAILSLGLRRSSSSGSVHENSSDAVLTTGCTFDLEAFGTVDPAYAGDAARTMRIKLSATPSTFADAIGQRFAKSAIEPLVFLKMVASVPDQICPKPLLDKAGDLRPTERFTLAVLLTEHCGTAYLSELKWDKNSKALTLIAKNGPAGMPVVSGVVTVSGRFFDVEPLFLFLGTLGPTAVDMLKVSGLPDASDDPKVRANALKVLRLRQAPFFGLDRKYTFSGDQELTLEAYRAYDPGHSSEYVLEALGRLTDDAAEFMPAVLDDITDAETRQFWHVSARFDDEQIPLKRRALLVALFANRERVEQMVLSRRRAEREAALDAIGVRDDLSTIAADIKGHELLPGYSAIALGAQLRQQDQLRDSLAATPDWAVAWRATILVQSHSLSLGLKYFVRRLVKSRGGDYTLLDPLL